MGTSRRPVAVPAPDDDGVLPSSAVMGEPGEGSGSSREKKKPRCRSLRRRPVTEGTWTARRGV